jgi:hypothetical protein
MNTLLQHRTRLANNPDAYEHDLVRVKGTTAPKHLKQCGFSRVTGELVNKFVEFVFETQERRPFFHVEVEGRPPFCWNAPKHWNEPYICYEWGHLRSRNQNEDAHQIENLCLQSARCNQHIQTSMNVEEVLQWLSGSRVATRINDVLERRRELFQSPEWKRLLADLEGFR